MHSSLSVLYEKLLNFLTPLERALLEKEENKNYEGSNINEIASVSLEQSKRVRKATLVCQQIFYGFSQTLHNYTCAIVDDGLQYL